ncbi:MAG: hypothetical protein HY889_07020 [Deltaproteobacteria bacterium]|nr:hypothetical protein [Deltaproteobacteria bacterium]
MGRKWILRGDEGFTLVELAIILVIIGMLVSLGAGMMGPLVKSAKYTESKDTVNSAIAGVMGFGTTNNRLPDSTEFASVVRSPRDSWGNSLYYLPDANLTTTNAGGVCGRKTTSLRVVMCPDAACAVPTSTITDVTFAVISGGANFNIQTDNSGGTIRVYSTGISPVDNYTGDMTRPEEYDDIVKWVTLNELRIKAGCDGAQLKIVNTDMPSGRVASAYSAAVYPDGGVPFTAGGKYRWCVQGSVPAGLAMSPNTLSVDCAGLAEGSWGKTDTIGFSGTPTAAGSYSLSVFVRDNNDTAGANDNVAQRSFVITVNP